MKRLLCALGVAFGLTVLAGSPVSAEPEPPTLPLTQPCGGNVHCPEGPEIPNGSPCSIDANGDGTPDFTGVTKTTKHGDVICNCLVIVPTTSTTSTTVPETTTTTEAPTTTSTTETPTTVVQPSTTVVQPSTTVVSPTTEEPPTTVLPRTNDTVRTEFVAKPAGARELPRTGSSLGPTLAMGTALVAAGALLVVLAHRRRLAA